MARMSGKYCVEFGGRQRSIYAGDYVSVSASGIFAANDMTGQKQAGVVQPAAFHDGSGSLAAFLRRLKNQTDGSAQAGTQFCKNPRTAKPDGYMAVMAAGVHRPWVPGTEMLPCWEMGVRRVFLCGQGVDVKTEHGNRAVSAGQGCDDSRFVTRDGAADVYKRQIISPEGKSFNSNSDRDTKKKEYEILLALQYISFYN